MQRIFVIVILVLLFMGILLTFNQLRDRELDRSTDTNASLSGQLDQLPRQTASINYTELNLYVTTNSTQVTKGLSDTTELPAGTGMLFYLPHQNQLNFWMRDMNYPIDMLWLDSNRHVVHIEPRVSPDTYPRNFSNPIGKPAEYVLELNSGDADQFDISIGDKLNLHEPVLDYLRASAPTASDTER